MSIEPRKNKSKNIHGNRAGLFIRFMLVYTCVFFLFAGAISCPYLVFAKKDSSYHSFTYYRIGLDVSKPFIHLLNNERRSYVFQMDVNYRKAMNMALEGGFGQSSVNQDRLKYNSANTYLGFGIDHPFFTEEFPGDKDNAFVGIRLATTFIQRQSATYSIQDPLWGASSGILPSKNIFTHWVELTGGFRLEVKRNFFAGWNMRLKSVVNPKSLAEAPPAYIAGYGRGDKNTAFDFNLYLLYGFGKR